jgi:hypothetical protein
MCVTITQYKDHNITVWPDLGIASPKRIGTISLYSMKRNIGDEQCPVDSIKAIAARDDVLCRWIYATIDGDKVELSTKTPLGRVPHAVLHSSITGIIWMPLTRVAQEYGDLNTAAINRAARHLEREVEEYNHYINSRYFKYKITNNEGAVVDSGSGYTDQAELIDNCRAIVDELTQNTWLYTLLSQLRSSVEAMDKLVDSIDEALKGASSNEQDSRN